MPHSILQGIADMNFAQISEEIFFNSPQIVLSSSVLGEIFLFLTIFSRERVVFAVFLQVSTWDMESLFHLLFGFLDLHSHNYV